MSLGFADMLQWPYNPANGQTYLGGDTAFAKPMHTHIHVSSKRRRTLQKGELEPPPRGRSTHGNGTAAD